MKIGLVCLLSALFFAVVAGGSVPVDAQPLFEPLSGLLWTAIAAVSFAVGICLVSESVNDSKRLQGVVLVSIAGAVVVYDFFAGGDATSVVRILCSLFVFGGFAHVLFKNRVVQMPSVLYNGPIVVFIASMMAAMLISEFRFIGADSLQYWALCIAAYFLATAVVGRVAGPRLVVETIIAGCTCVALKGIVEYLFMRADEPTFRIFADWNNPNALAGMLVGAFPLAVGLACASKGVRQYFALAGGTVITVAIALTQSKGGLLVFAFALVAFLAVALLWRARSKALLVFVPILAGAALFMLVQPRPAAPKIDPIATRSAPVGGGAAPMQRVINSQGESIQSTAYRKLLWKGAILAWKEQPVGYGPGAYKFYSARAGLTEQTQLAHQSYLQIAVEGGALAALSIFFLAVVWMVRMFRGAGPLSFERNMLRAGVVASVAAIGANGFVESNFYFLGTGLCLFVLLATGLQLAADGTAPESMPRPLRMSMVVLMCLLPLVVSVWAVRLELAKSALVGALLKMDRPNIAVATSALQSTKLLDDEALNLLAMVETDATKRLELLKQAVATGPRTKNLRALAEEQSRHGDNKSAIETLNRALLYDPNNLRTLFRLMETQDRLEDTTAVAMTANRIVSVEGTDYLKVRAIPELVQTEPFSARIKLATLATDKLQKAKLLSEALAGFMRYRQITVPKIFEFAKGGYDYGSETVETAKAKMAEGQKAATELEQIYSSNGDSAGVEGVRSLAKGLALD